MDTGALVSELEALRSVSETQVDALGTNTDAVAQNTVSRSSGGSGVAQTVASTLGKTALSMIPLLGVFTHLFGGSSQPETPPAPVKYEPPPSIQIDGTTSAPPTPPPPSAAPQAVPPVTLAAPQVTIQVQAMDSRSFLDHSHEIAQAVREAMLNMHPLNDVVSEL
jgi:hypothetical protein